MKKKKIERNDSTLNDVGSDTATNNNSTKEQKKNFFFFFSHFYSCAIGLVNNWIVYLAFLPMMYETNHSNSFKSLIFDLIGYWHITCKRDWIWIRSIRQCKIDTVDGFYFVSLKHKKKIGIVGFRNNCCSLYSSFERSSQWIQHASLCTWRQNRSVQRRHCLSQIRSIYT